MPGEKLSFSFECLSGEVREMRVLISSFGGRARDGVGEGVLEKHS